MGGAYGTQLIGLYIRGSPWTSSGTGRLLVLELLKNNKYSGENCAFHLLMQSSSMEWSGVEWFPAHLFFFLDVVCFFICITYLYFRVTY